MGRNFGPPLNTVYFQIDATRIFVRTFSLSFNSFTIIIYVSSRNSCANIEDPVVIVAVATAVVIVLDLVILVTRYEKLELYYQSSNINFNHIFKFNKAFPC